AAEGSAEAVDEKCEGPGGVRRAVLQPPQGIRRLDSRRQEARDARRAADEDYRDALEGQEESVRQVRSRSCSSGKSSRRPDSPRAFSAPAGATPSSATLPGSTNCASTRRSLESGTHSPPAS